ncbi:MAG: hypothetical protein R2752_13065 [Vicinamibacterales bacterium]
MALIGVAATPRRPLAARTRASGCAGRDLLRSRRRRTPHQRVEDRQRRLDPGHRVGHGRGEPLDELPDAVGVGPGEPAVLEVDVVDDLGDLDEGRVRERQVGEQGLERAPIVLVRERRARHVERQVPRSGAVAWRHETEPRVVGSMKRRTSHAVARRSTWGPRG